MSSPTPARTYVGRSTGLLPRQLPTHCSIRHPIRRPARSRLWGRAARSGGRMRPPRRRSPVSWAGSGRLSVAFSGICIVRRQKPPRRYIYRRSSFRSATGRLNLACLTPACFSRPVSRVASVPCRSNTAIAAGHRPGIFVPAIAGRCRGDD